MLSVVMLSEDRARLGCLDTVAEDVLLLSVLEVVMLSEACARLGCLDSVAEGV